LLKLLIASVISLRTYPPLSNIFMAILTISAWAKALIILFKYSEFGPLAQGCKSFKIFDTNIKIFEIA